MIQILHVQVMNDLYAVFIAPLDHCVELHLVNDNSSLMVIRKLVKLHHLSRMDVM